MIERIQSFVDRHRLIDFDQPIVVGISGGADSVALLHVLKHWKLPIIALHCNFHLRAEESDRDCRFVEDLCQSWHIPCEIIHFDTSAYAQKRGISIEMAARDLRYEWFEQQRIKHNAASIAVAHHQDDRKETILLNILRGTGLRGLVALHPQQGNVIRPLLSVKQSEILDYCNARSLSYVDDSTNFQSICQRNRIRLELLPLMEAITAGAGDRLLRMADQLEYPLQLVENETRQFLNNHALTTPSYTLIPTKSLIEHPNYSDLLFEILRPLSFKSTQLDDIIRSFSVLETKQFFSSTHRIVKERDSLYLTDLTIPTNCAFPIPDSSTNYILPIELHLEMIGCNDREIPFVNDRKTVLVDHDKLSFPLILRRPKQGERFAPINMKGTKLVSDYLKDAKLPLLDRENVWVIASSDSIVWIVGQRADDRFKVTKETRRILKISILSND